MKIRIILFVGLLLSSADLLAQSTIELTVHTLNYEKNSPCKTAVVETYSGEELLNTIPSTTKKGVNLELALGEIYRIEVSAPKRVTRFFNIDLTSENLTDERVHLIKMDVDISLFIEEKDVDYSYVLSNPVIAFYYDSDSETFTFNEAETKVMASKIEELTGGKQKK